MCEKSVNIFTVYILRPIVQSGKKVEVPKGMYKMKNVNNDGFDGHSRQENNTLSNFTEQAPFKEVAALQRRQEKALAQLSELTEQMQSLCSVLRCQDQALNCDEQKEMIMLMNEKKIWRHVNMDLTLNLDPSRQCYSVLALGKLWSDVDFPIQCHKSSTGKAEISSYLKNTEETGKSISIRLSMIWNQNVMDTYSMLSGVYSYPIIGEVNFLRYFCRLLGYEGYEHSIETFKIDSIFDLTHKLIHENNRKKAEAYVSFLSRKLSKNSYFSGKRQPGVADVAVWSAIKQLSLKLPQNLSAWFCNSDKIFMR